MPKQKDQLALNPGDLRHALTFMQRSITNDTVSGATETWTDYVTVHASIEPLRGTDLIRSGQDVTQIYMTVTMWYRPDVDTTMRVRSQHGTYVIQAIENLLERNRVLRLTCLAVGSNN